MQVLRQGVKGDKVTAWQHFLIGQGFSLSADGDFGEATVAATKMLQHVRGLVDDGVVGNQTAAIAMQIGFNVVDDPGNSDKTGPNWPPKPLFGPLTSTEQRQAMFGKFAYHEKPVSGNLENIVVDDDWANENLVVVNIPQLKKLGPNSGKVEFHRLAAKQLQGMFAAWEEANLLDRILSWDGTYCPRLIRGGKSLSNHAFGTALDMNVVWNPLGAQPALVGKKGSVRELVPIANEFGFYWGGHYNKRSDGMHLEVAILKG